MRDRSTNLIVIEDSNGLLIEKYEKALVNSFFKLISCPISLCILENREKFNIVLIIKDSVIPILRLKWHYKFSRFHRSPIDLGKGPSSK